MRLSINCFYQQATGYATGHVHMVNLSLHQWAICSVHVQQLASFDELACMQWLASMSFLGIDMHLYRYMLVVTDLQIYFQSFS